MKIAVFIGLREDQLGLIGRAKWVEKYSVVHPLLFHQPLLSRVGRQ
jgi:hypothetical protein